MHKINSYTLTGILLSVVGFVCLILTLTFGGDYYQVYKYGEKTTCVVKFIRPNEFSTIVEYKVNDDLIIKDLGIYDSSVKRDDKMTIYYDKNNANKAFVKSQISLWIMLLIISLVILAMGLYFFIINYMKRKMHNWLLENGKLIKANIVGIEGKKYLRIFKKHPAHIRAEYEEKGNNYTFISEETYFDLKSLIKKENIREINIYLDKDNYHKYYVDIDSIINKM